MQGAAARASIRPRKPIFGQTGRTNFWSATSMVSARLILTIFPQRAWDESLGEVIERACGRVPKLENAQVMRGVTGVYDMTPDSRPLLGEIPGITGLHVCAGFSGMGFKISPAIGLVMSELVLDGIAKTVDISPFRPQRSPKANRSWAEYEYLTTR